MCVRCRAALHLRTHEDSSAFGDGHGYGCEGCGRRYCSGCGVELDQRCPRCQGRLDPDVTYPWLIEPVADWRTLIVPDDPEFEPALPSATLLASILPSDLEDLERALSPSQQAWFWDDVLTWESGRRLGALDGLVDANFEEWRFDASLLDRLEQAADWKLRRGAAATFGKRHRLAELALLGHRARESVGDIVALAFDPEPSVCSAALDLARGLGPALGDVAGEILRALHAPEREVRRRGLELLCGQRFLLRDERALANQIFTIVDDALANVDLPLLRRCLAEPRWNALTILARALEIRERALPCVAAVLGSDRWTTAVWAVPWLRILGPHAATLVPRLLEIDATLHPIAYAADRLGPFDEADVPAIVAACRARGGLLAALTELVARASLSAPDDGDDAAIERVRARLDAGEAVPLVLSVVLALPDGIARRVLAGREAGDVLADDYRRHVDDYWVPEPVLSAHPSRLFSSPALRAVIVDRLQRRLDDALPLTALMPEASRLRPMVLASAKLRRQHPWSRLEAVRALGELATRDDTLHPELLALFCDAREPGTIRVAAAQALDRIGVPAWARRQIASLATDEPACVGMWARVLSEA